MWCLCPCQARGPVVEKNTTLDVDAWIEKTRKNNASSPSTTEMPYAVLAHCHKDQGVDGEFQKHAFENFQLS